MLEHDREWRLAIKWQPTCQAQECGGAQIIDVTAEIDFDPITLLRRHERRRADAHTRGGDADLRDIALGEPEVADLHQAIAANHQIVGFDVAMDDIFFSGGL